MQMERIRVFARFVAPIVGHADDNTPTWRKESMKFRQKRFRVLDML